MKNPTIAVIGDGGWGTTLALHLADKEFEIQLWSCSKDYAQRMQKNRYNSKFLPGFRLPMNIAITHDLKKVLEFGEIIVFAVPSKYTSDVLQKMRATGVNLVYKPFVSVTKGFDHASLTRISQIAQQILGQGIPIAVLSGPTIASEVAKKIPSTAVIACKEHKIGRLLQRIFTSPAFRIYTNTDVVGVEIGGSVKNIIALACGVCDGLGFGTNTKAAIVTRGLAEMSRLGKALGAKPQTFAGLSGIGDLVTTCFNPQSRNRSVGEKIGRGMPIKEILSKMEMVAEGVETSKSIFELSQKLNVSMPITAEIYQLIYKGKSPQETVNDLMTREMKAE